MSYDNSIFVLRYQWPDELYIETATISLVLVGLQIRILAEAQVHKYF